uniref:NADH-ubiquinone oxidoreductase chain 6 n=1 Tax=Trigonotylus caelestialium TaxID=881767 RepID=A0A0F6MY71_9HEMI|nr:NADH dehydrogenase subunit 6 [Trigonotylus caelestialium]
MMLILSIMLTISILLLFTKHPMSMGVLLILQTIMTSTLTGLMMNTFWTSYILLISMLSGMLVLFIYMSSMASNEKFSSNIKLAVISLLVILMGGILWYMENLMIIKSNFINLMTEETFFLNKMFDKKNMFIIILMVNYLFMTMIVSTHLVNIFEGPMRSKN